MVDKSKRLIFVSALVFSILTAGAFSARAAYAQDADTQNTLVQMIAQKFGLKTSDVQMVFNQYRNERQLQMESQYEQLLTDAVNNGRLTEEKKQLLIAKHKELIEKHSQEASSLQTMTPEERRTQREKERTDMEQWAKDHDIDTQYLFIGHGKGMHMRGASKMMK